MTIRTVVVSVICLAFENFLSYTGFIRVQGYTSALPLDPVHFIDIQSQVGEWKQICLESIRGDIFIGTDIPLEGASLIMNFVKGNALLDEKSTSICTVQTVIECRNVRG